MGTARRFMSVEILSTAVQRMAGSSRFAACRSK